MATRVAGGEEARSGEKNALFKIEKAILILFLEKELYLISLVYKYGSLYGELSYLEGVLPSLIINLSSI